MKFLFNDLFCQVNIVDGAKQFWPGSQEAATPQRGIELVDSLSKQGAGFIKVYSRLLPETFIAIATRCKELNIKFAGRVPWKVSLVDAPPFFPDETPARLEQHRLKEI